MFKRKYRNLFNTIAISLLIGMLIGYAGNNKKVLSFLDDTDSFNFTTSADIRNAENVIIVNNREIATKYIQNWFARKERSETSKLKRGT